MEWNQETLETAWDGFELCYECEGKKLCPESPHAYCKGWCHVCGGAGQWPRDPKQRYYAPATPLINLEHRAAMRDKAER